jgi:hypothetical protein
VSKTLEVCPRCLRYARVGVTRCLMYVGYAHEVCSCEVRCPRGPRGGLRILEVRSRWLRRALGGYKVS